LLIFSNNHCRNNGKIQNDHNDKNDKNEDNNDHEKSWSNDDAQHCQLYVLLEDTVARPIEALYHNERRAFQVRIWPYSQTHELLQAEADRALRETVHYRSQVADLERELSDVRRALEQAQTERKAEVCVDVL
jgi:hypothetical protein